MPSEYHSVASVELPPDEAAQVLLGPVRFVAGNFPDLSQRSDHAFVRTPEGGGRVKDEEVDELGVSSIVSAEGNVLMQ